MEQTTDEIKRLQGCINDLISVLALPAIWSDHDPAHILSTLLDVLSGMLRLDFAYVRLNDLNNGSPIEVVRLAQRLNPASQTQHLSRAVDLWLTRQLSQRRLVVPNPIGEGEVSIALLQLGLQDEVGILVAGSRRGDFPTEIETLLLRVAANQAAIGLQEARDITEHKRAEEELEQRAAERTRQLAAVNEEMQIEISERERAEQALHENQQRLRAILENSPSIVFLKDADGRYLDCNHAFEKLCALNRERIIGKTDWELFPPQQASEFHSNDLEVLKSGRPMEFEETALHSDGLHTSIVSKFPLRRVAGRIDSIGGIVTDITERKKTAVETLALKDELAADLKAMTRLHELSTRLLASTEIQSLLEEVLDATMTLLNADFGDVQLYNPKTHALEIVAHRNFSQEYLDYFNNAHEGTASCGTAPLARARVIVEDVLTDPSFAPHLKVVAAAGYRAVQSTPLFSRSGEPLGMISTYLRKPHRPSEHELRFTDLYARQAAEMIERKRDEDALRASEERFRRYFELGLIGMAITSPAKDCLEVNDELCRILGYERSELLQQSWAEMTHPDDLAADVAQFNRIMAGEIDGYSMDKRWIRKDGQVIDTTMAARCLRRGDGSVDYFVGLVQDITVRKRAEEELHAAHAELAHVTRLTTMGELAASIAHEVNQPLAAVVTNGNAALRWLAAANPNLHEAREALARIVRDGNRASDVIKRIRTLVKKTSAEKERLDMNVAIQDVIDLAQGEIRKNGVTLRTQLADELPPLMGDRVQLQQVVLNLLMNGIEAMSEVEDRPRELVVKTQKDSVDNLHVAVQDSGRGLDPQYLDRMFDAFYTTKRDGMGMGLSISRSIIEAHSGQLWATANDGPGTTLHIALPVCDADTI
jgi:PAS domain S-box-containing protein